MVPWHRLPLPGMLATSETASQLPDPIPGVPLLLSPNLTEAKLLSGGEEERNLVCEAVACDRGSQLLFFTPEASASCLLTHGKECACASFTQVKKATILTSPRTRLPCKVYNFQGSFKNRDIPCLQQGYIHTGSLLWLLRQQDPNSNGDTSKGSCLAPFDLSSQAFGSS